MSIQNRNSRVGIATSLRFLDHDTGDNHPERPARLQGILEKISEREIRDRLVSIEFEECSRAGLLAVHTEEYLTIAQRDIEARVRTLSTGDTNVSAESWQIAQLGAAASMAAVDAVCGNDADVAFCALRPPGHHASPARGMGFCILNNIAIAARHAQRSHGLQRALIVDWDVHHGNGTQDVFYDDPSVLFFSTHQWPLYPGTGAADERGSGDAVGLTINVPLPIGSGRAEVFGAFEEQLMPAVERFRPNIVLISAGFDSRRGDPLGGFQLTDEDFFDLTQMMMKVADEHAEGRLVSFLEGGYSVSGLASAVATHLSALLGDGFEPDGS